MDPAAPPDEVIRRARRHVQNVDRAEEAEGASCGRRRSEGAGGGGGRVTTNQSASREALPSGSADRPRATARRGPRARQRDGRSRHRDDAGTFPEPRRDQFGRRGATDQGDEELVARPPPTGNVERRTGPATIPKSRSSHRSGERRVGEAARATARRAGGMRSRWRGSRLAASEEARSDAGWPSRGCRQGDVTTRPASGSIVTQSPRSRRSAEDVRREQRAADPHRGPRISRPVSRPVSAPPRTAASPATITCSIPSG